MIWFDSTASSEAIVGFIGEKIDSSFVANDAFYKFIYDKSYTSSKLTAMDLELDDNFTVSAIAPTRYFEEILD